MYAYNFLEPLAKVRKRSLMLSVRFEVQIEKIGRLLAYIIMIHFALLTSGLVLC